MPLDRYGQEIGVPVPDWTPRRRPPRTPMHGLYCRLEPLDPAHADALFAAYAAAPDGRDWTYLPGGRIDDLDAYRREIEARARSVDPLHFAVMDSTDTPLGTAALMRIDVDNGVVEIGHVAFSRALRRTRTATEAVALLLRRAFDELSYRRVEWKCDALNAASVRAALRYGFVREGTFRQAIVTKGRNRDTAWFAMLDRDWADRRVALERWLAPDNFDAAGRQRATLSSLG